ncbi:MAG: quinone-dependent dihydroorotate dehydrogenase [Bacteroidales bacterium]|jgi:dihydroorotate dehydrogenase|nr:quinone-dependent dihydroorotate dehydrogenase [Bacteroidales bacterium]
MYRFFRPVFFKFSAETMHGFVAGLMRLAYVIFPVRVLLRRYFCIRHPALEREFCGIHFANPVGLAAGFDKNATLYKAFSLLGFSFIEIGTVTPEKQQGNSKPRLFRIVEDGALVNRMGFNNKGVDAAVKHLKSSHPGIVIGGNIGKNTATPNADATLDYVQCFKKLYPYVDYFTVNVSCPNVAHLNELQNKESLTGILSAIVRERNQQEKRKPVLVKISPDLSIMQLKEILQIVEKEKIDGIVAVNTTTQRTDLASGEEYVKSIGNGGMSGKPLKWKALETINYIRQYTGGKLPVIGVGGIMSGKDAIDLIHAGATLVQVYSGLVYEGPTLVKKINQAVLQLSKK